MDMGIDKAKLQQYKANVVKLLADPGKMRLVVVMVLAGLAVGAVYMPISDRIEESGRKTAAERKRFDVIKDVETLRTEANTYRPRISEKGDTNDWVQYLLGGLRQAKVGLRDMESKEAQEVGPYKAVNLALVVEGTFPQLRQFLEWLEQSDRLLRIDLIRLERQAGVVTMKVQVLGLVRKNA